MLTSPLVLPTGNLALTLDPNSEPSCFAAEAYARDLGAHEAAEDTKVSYALLMLQGLFGAWASSLGVPHEQIREAAALIRCAFDLKSTTNLEIIPNC